MFVVIKTGVNCTKYFSVLCLFTEFALFYALIAFLVMFRTILSLLVVVLMEVI